MQQLKNANHYIKNALNLKCFLYAMGFLSPTATAQKTDLAQRVDSGKMDNKIISKNDLKSQLRADLDMMNLKGRLAYEKGSMY